MDGAIDTLGSASDFDFFIGDWNIRNLRLKERFAGSDDWEIFPATSSVRKILEGTGNFEEMHMPSQGFTGMTLRLFNPRDGSWSLNWADSRSNVLFPPVIGHFDNGKGVFYGEDMDDGVPVRVRFLWTPSVEAPVWAQAFSRDGGETWETNWVMEFTRASRKDRSNLG
ncbi:hypothetical protein [Phyllobacterium endophyticum]|uniref:DUF1579 domain-containing protein n=1 Tax=Phyllobacterium endophyticum TaxID=1149773 RepID=A0A2P7B006_9HYPH|nr:hypothetical protein [Phyllobacterium endophyticum]MBB3235643.1 hypothetical protein [Phyllobacterium endophyticum]PSH59734.1 hypothetical protein CU100_02920 [Phyllobacterium endophyticum]TYR41880.1 hypothetical protein FY050_11535 [Phyllobacterium endophyticum]